MIFTIEDKTVGLLEHLSLHGTKVSIKSLPVYASKEELIERLKEYGLVYDFIENTETGRTALHLTMIGREACRQLKKKF